MRLDSAPIIALKRYVDERRSVLRKSLESLSTDEKTTHVIRGQLHELLLLHAAIDEDASKADEPTPPGKTFYA